MKDIQKEDPYKPERLFFSAQHGNVCVLDKTVDHDGKCCVSGDDVDIALQ